MTRHLIQFIRDYYQTNEFVPLHAPTFQGNELAYVTETIHSTFVSSVGQYVNQLEQDVASYTGSERAIATVSGTAALHTALKLVGVGHNDLVITQSLTFVATCNAIAYCGATPVFVDVDLETLGMSAEALENWLNENARIDSQGICRHNASDRRIQACLPMHTFGHPVDLDGLVRVAADWHLILIEDAAESLGSLYKGQHTGTFGKLGVLSFNGNKIMTTGGGGMILTQGELAQKAKHITTTAKQPHAYEFVHDEIGFNYRLPNLNAALGCAQLEQIDRIVDQKRKLADAYESTLDSTTLQFLKEPAQCRSNYWLNAVICEDEKQRNELLETTNQQGVMTRPIWKLMSDLPMFSDCFQDALKNSRWLADRVVNLPSSVRATL